MSPEAATADQVYNQLKVDIKSGRYAPTAFLNVHMIAKEIGVSVSPIRDAMERLVGERLLSVRIGGGFQMPLMTPALARDLYSWHGYLARGAIRSCVPIDDVNFLIQRLALLSEEDGAGLVSATEQLFGLIGEASGNREHFFAIRTAGERLHALRLQEVRLKDRRAELSRLAQTMLSSPLSALRNTIAAYHRRRLHHVPELVSPLFHSDS